jgi:hypothetical protein
MTLREYIAEAEANGFRSGNYNKNTDDQYLPNGGKGYMRGKEVSKAYTGNNFTKGSYNKSSDAERDRTYDRKNSSNNVEGERTGNDLVNKKLNYEKFSDQRLNNDRENRRDKTGNNFTSEKSSNRFDDNRLNGGKGIEKGNDKTLKGGETGHFFRDLRSSDSNIDAEHDRDTVGTSPRVSKNDAMKKKVDAFTKLTDMSKQSNNTDEYDKDYVSRRGARSRK